MELLAIVLSLACFALACVLLYRLVARDFGPRVAWLTLTYTALFPTSFFFSAAYSESLFLALTVACFLAAQRRRWLLAGLAGAAATLTRNSGLLLVVPFLLYYYGARDWRLGRSDGWLASVALIPAGLVAYMAYLQARFGDPLAFSRAERKWGRFFDWFPTTVWRGLTRAVVGAEHLMAGDATRLHFNIPLLNVLGFAFLVVAVLALWLGRHRLPLPYLAYAVLTLVFVTSFPSAGKPLLSLPRFVAVLFPLFVAFALWTEQRRWARIALAAAFTLGLVVLTARFALYYFVA